jgi:F-type H+-transporting ATPase subunit a
VEVLGLTITWMSSGIAQMLLVAGALTGGILLLARRREGLPRGGYNVLEVVVTFVREQIAKPALHAKADAFMPFLLTLFVFVLGMNLSGILPLGSLTPIVGRPMGTTPTGILTVCGALASITLLAILGCGLAKTAHTAVEKGWSTPLAILAAPVLWVWSLSPHIGGPAGVIFRPFLAFLELIGAFAKCFALVIRLFANMLAGHILLAVMMMLIMQNLLVWLDGMVGNVFRLGPVLICLGASVLIDLLELMVAGIQAYIFTFLSATFLGLYVEPEH